MTTRRHANTAAGLLALLAATLAATAAPSQQPTRALRRALARDASGKWRDAPLGETLGRIADAFSTPLWVDRRVDPNRPLTLVAPAQPVASLLDAVAREADLGAATIDGVVYLGPRRSAAAAAALAGAWRADAPRGMSHREASAWPRLTAPRDLAARFAAEARVRIANPDAVPHDLWPQGETPRLTAGDRLTLLLLGFDLRWVANADGKSIRVEPIDYASLPHEAATLASLVGNGRAQEVERRFTLRVVEQPLVPVLRQLAQQLGRELLIEGDTPSGRVSFQVEKAPLDEMLGAIGDAAGVRLRATPTQIVLRPGGD